LFHKLRFRKKGLIVTQTMSPQRKLVYYITKFEVATSELIVPLILGRKANGHIVTQNKRA